MENLNLLKIELIAEICACKNENLLQKISTLLNSDQISIVADPHSIYETEKPMTDEEVEEYFKEETVELTPFQMKMVLQGLEDVKHGRVHDNDEIEKYFEEWLED